MKKLILKSIIYVFLIIVTLEFIVRAFHLHTEAPERYIDKFEVEKYLPNQTGYAVTGNRRQNFSEYKTNNFGFNSFREFNPSENKIEIALIGDSFIEGFHQDYDVSTGKKIETKLNNKVEVYEYGYGGYDLANQLFLIHAYKDHFKKIDHIIFYLKYENDLERSVFTPNYDRIAMLKSPLFRIRDNFKLLSYASSIGIIDPIKNMAIDIMHGKKEQQSISDDEKLNEDLKNLENFKTLINTFGFEKDRMSFLLDSSATSEVFLNYFNDNGYHIIDFSNTFNSSTEPPTLIYDMHWNDHGRDLIASEISTFINNKLNL
ncbi:hypothetical protein EYD45_01065 [Hyunsoonleella flava]|uniref:SGNH/GDSL hydrolase family protein n=1 Tax=Hyunsoonleella flava TaxID=2527939 RepID=A0A4Q9FGD1_9FLAO|nr:hypothetical protein [Hyunsoonleella flava]TBN06503.1 hypothetical protein EYD45_01065 [Hyunsoonleella flava]